MITDQTLNRNAVKKFVLRIDLIPTDEFNYINLVNGMAKYFDRVESRSVNNFIINFTQAESMARKVQAFDHVLVADSKGYSVTISEPQNAIVFESNVYRDNSTYKEFVEQLYEQLSQLAPTISSKRIGLRYVNEFSCDSIKMINSFFGKRLSTIIKLMLNNDSQSRAIGLEEFNTQETKSRIQYGIPNKHYPSAILRPDILLDIDCYSDSLTPLNDWSSIIRTLNHAAYDRFISEINPKQLDKLK